MLKVQQSIQRAKKHCQEVVEGSSVSIHTPLKTLCTSIAKTAHTYSSATALTSLARKQARTTTPADAIKPNSDPLVRARWIYVIQWRLMILMGLLGRRSLKHRPPCKMQLRKLACCISNTALIFALEHLKSPVTLTAAFAPVLGKRGWWP